MFNRRDFLRYSMMSLGASALPTSVGQARAQTAGDYKALVCIFLHGGMDGHDTIIPHDEEEYAAWANIRETLLQNYDESGMLEHRLRDGLIPLTNDGQASGYAVPGDLGGIADLYGRGKLAVIANVGPLMEPGTLSDFRAGRIRVPGALMSHNHQSKVWQSVLDRGTTSGWAGRLLETMGESSSTYAAITTAGSSLFLDGVLSRGYAVAENAEVRAINALGYKNYGSTTFRNVMREHLTESGTELTNLHAQDLVQVRGEAVSTISELAGVMDKSDAGENLRISDNILAQRLCSVAKIISGQSTLGANRQIFYCSLGGFDTHGAQAQRLPSLQRKLQEAIVAFYEETERLGIADQVTTFTSSDFGRTLRSNRNGTDHGWGNHHMVVGGAVNGGRLLGEMAPMGFEHQHDFGGGRLMPTTSVEQYAGSLARWFGLEEQLLSEVFPNYSRFDPDRIQLF